MTHTGWYTRGYLPHRDEPGLIQAVTFHLADSLPLQLLQEGRQSMHPRVRRAGSGAAGPGLGRVPAGWTSVAEIVEDAAAL